MMNDQENTLVRQSKWSGRRIVLFYWFAIVFLGTSAAAGLGTSVFKPVYKIEADPHDGITDPWGPDDCVACHADEVTGWETTWHAAMVQPFADGADDPQNGTRVNYNSTHYWRIPKTMSNESDPLNFTNIQYWTYNELFNASSQQCCMTTRWYYVYNTTTEVFNTTLSEELGGYTSNIWDMGVSCAACHDNPGEFDLSYSTCSGCHMPGGRQPLYYTMSGHFGSLNDILASYETLDDLMASGDMFSLEGEGYWAYVGQSTYFSMYELDVTDYYGITCVTCHDPHDSTVNAAKVSQAFSPWKNPYTNVTYGPGGSQLRTATTNDLCGTCHDINLDTSTGGFIDPTTHVGFDCTDCHGYSISSRTGLVSDLSHNWRFSYSESGCGVCHDTTTTMNASEALSAMGTYLDNFGNLTDMKAVYDAKLVNATAAWDAANATAGVDMAKLANADSLIDEAKDLAAGTKYAFHDPEKGWAADEVQLSLALTKLDAAVKEATDALPGPVEPTTTTVPVTTTEEPATTEEPTTTSPAPAIGLLAAMSILGVVTVFRRKRR